MMKKNSSERGSALLLVTIVTLILVGISGAYMSVSWYNKRKADQDVYGAQALYIAESVAAIVINQTNHPLFPVGTPQTPPPTPLPVGRPVFTDQPQKFGGGTYLVPHFAVSLDKNGNIAPTKGLTVDVSGNLIATGTAPVVKTFVDYKNEPAPNQDDNYVRLQVYGTYNGVTRKVDVLLSQAAGGVFWNAVYAGNSSGSAYQLGFNGVGTGNDSIQGDMYSGGDFSATGTTSLTGTSGTGNPTITVAGTKDPSSISGPTYKSGTEPGLTIPRNSSGQTNWELQAQALRTGSRLDSTGVAYIDVAYDLTPTSGRGATVNNRWGPDGSVATDITNVNEPAHIFRKNPTSTDGSTNRTNKYEFAAHAKNDYYLEDPTNSSVTHASLTGVPVNGDTSASAINVQTNGNNAVYFIDGNMRVSGENIKSYQLTPGAGVSAVEMTVVVKGNVSMTDNVLYPRWQSATDGLAIIAVQDPAFPNVTAANFNANSTLTAASGFDVSQFVADYNARTQAARNSGSIIPALPTTNPVLWAQADRERAAQEYNKAYGSGNVYFGDPGSGTVEHFEGFMYAENNFYATNLNSNTGSGGTQKVEIYGNMTAGNQVKITRQQFDNSGNPLGYIPLRVTFDQLITTPAGVPKPPALPATPSFGSGTWFIANWKQVP
jgi:hypothetical protein